MHDNITSQQYSSACNITAVDPPLVLTSERDLRYLDVGILQRMRKSRVDTRSSGLAVLVLFANICTQDARRFWKSEGLTENLAWKSMSKTITAFLLLQYIPLKWEQKKQQNNALRKQNPSIYAKTRPAKPITAGHHPADHDASTIHPDQAANAASRSSHPIC